MYGYNSPMPPDPYEALGIDKSAPLAAIRSAHRKLVLACHPDRSTFIDEAAKEAATDRFHLVQQAYLLLSDESRRELHDQEVKLAELRASLKEEKERLKSWEARSDTQVEPIIAEAQGRNPPNGQHYRLGDNRKPSFFARRFLDARNLTGKEREDKRHESWEARSNTSVEPIVAEAQGRNLLSGQNYRPGGKTTRSPHHFSISTTSFARSLSTRVWEAKERLRESGTKWKQGLAGFANNSRISAIADTGSQKNVISASYAAKLGLRIENLPSSFTLGNSRRLNSIGTVSLRWSFAETPEEAVSIICHVLPRCIYDLILGNGFLTATETMSRFRHRLTLCLFPVASQHATFAFLGETCQRLEGVLAGKYNVLAVPDSGAERNVMDLQYAIDHGFKIKEETENRNWLQFADGSYEETIGQVDSYWEFATGTQIPVTFEILENCCSDVVIGEEVLTRHNVFDSHASSLISWEASPDSYELAPFDFISRWQQHLGSKRGGAPKNDQNHTPNPHNEERRRRDIWNFEHNYGANASAIERELETARRTRYDTGGTAARMPVIPSIPTAPAGR